MKPKRKKLSAYQTSIVIISVFVAASLILSLITSFCDFYTDHIFSFGIQTYGRLTGLFPFSAGEFLIVLAALLIILQLIFALLLISFHKRQRYRQFVRTYSKCMLTAALLTTGVVTLNCSMLYNCSRLDPGGGRQTESDPGQIRVLRDFIVERCNTLSGQMTRDENGDVVTNGDLNEEIKTAMQKLSADYPRLSGYYPNPKPIFASFLMYQAGYDGVYFPFSLEANYNTYISDIRYPHIACHELAHLKGYIYENEADFIAYLACVGSDDIQLQYAGYLGVLSYIESDYRQTIRGGEDAPAQEIADRVRRDAASYTRATYEKLTEKEKEKIIDSEVVETASRRFTDAYMDYYGAEPNYAEVTKLLLAYYGENGGPAQGQTPDHS